MSKRRQNIMKIVLIIIYLLLSVSGLTLMKMGGNPGTVSIQSNTFSFGISITSAIGLICYILSFLLFTRIVTLFDLSYIMPICTGIVQILTLVAAMVVLKEEFSWRIVIGASIIIIGIIVMNIKK